MSGAETPAPTGDEMITQAILASAANYQWHLTSRGAKPIEAASHCTIYRDDAAKLIKTCFGVDAPTTATGPQRGFNPAPGFVQRLVREGEHLTRAQYLMRVHKILRVAGMGSGQPDAQLTMIWDCARPPRSDWNERIPPILANYLTIKVAWQHDGSVTLQCVELSGDGEQVYELYVWRGCEHEIVGESAGRSYVKYHCTKCPHRYEIDSGD